MKAAGSNDEGTAFQRKETTTGQHRFEKRVILMNVRDIVLWKHQDTTQMVDSGH